MSFSALNWAWEQSCPSGVAKSVLVYLANCASQEGGDCYPSVPKIALRVQHQEETVRKALKALVKADLLEIESRVAQNGRQTSNRYRLPVVSIATPPNSGGYESEPDAWTPTWDTPPKTGGYENCASQPDTPPISGGGTPPISGGNPSLDSYVEEKEETSLRSVACASAPATPETTETNVVVLSVVNEAQQVVEAWNAMAQAHDLPRLRVGETARRKAAALIRKNGIADVLRAIEAVGESPLCTGATTGWRADFYFLNQAVSFERLLSGFYADHPERVRARAGTQAAVKQKFQLPTYQPRFDPEPDDIGRIAQ